MSELSLVILALLAVSEVLALVPAIAANSVFQLVYSIIKGLAGRVSALFKGSKEEKIEVPSPKKSKK